MTFTRKIDLDKQQRLFMFGNRLQGYRKAAKMTLQQVAEETGLSTALIQQLEGGFKGLTVDALVCLSRAYGVSMDEIVNIKDARECAYGGYMYRRGR